jgi:glycosyltransferase involved in cell wall biosynthesis
MMSAANKKPVIMQILPSLQSGGVERGTVDLAKALQKEGFEPIVVSSGGVMTYQLREAKIQHIELPVKTKNPLRIFCNIDEIADLIAEYKVDIVHVRSRAPMISAYFACKKTKTKLVSTVHGSYSTGFLWWKAFPVKMFYNAMMLRADRVIAVSNFIKDYLLQNYQSYFKQPLEAKIDVVARGVDVNYFNAESISMTRMIDLSTKWALPEDKKIIIFPARITSWKGHKFLIQALAAVKSDFFCVFVGSDHGHKSFRKKIEQKIVKSGLEGRVKFVGMCKDMPVAYAISNLVISASLRPEAFGRIAIEAQAMKKMIIATNIGGSLETIIDDETGFLVEVGNVEKMAEAIDKALTLDKSVSDKICENARKHIENNFSSQKMCAETIKIYRKIL